ncbi:hypothetical protein BC829DRAFT_446146 [Chytridium lagenaria]|nr:hypothetical protein BC829DRAFT_446146 [Chytridium lagenaria]
MPPSNTTPASKANPQPNSMIPSSSQAIATTSYIGGLQKILFDWMIVPFLNGFVFRGLQVLIGPRVTRRGGA